MYVLKMDRVHVNFYRLVKILSLIIKRPIQDGVKIKADAVVPCQYQSELNEIRSDLKKMGGKYRSRTQNKRKLKIYLDLWRRMGLKMNKKIGMKIQKIIIGKDRNGSRIQSLSYKYN